MPGFEHAEELVVGLFDGGYLRFGEPGSTVMNSKRKSCVYFKPDKIASVQPGFIGQEGVIILPEQQRRNFDLAIQGMSVAIDRIESHHQHLLGIPQSFTALGMAVAMSRTPRESYLWQRARNRLAAAEEKPPIIGHYRAYDSAIGLDNALTTGAEFMDTAATAENAKIPLFVHALAVMLDRQEGGSETLQADGSEVVSVFTLSEAVDILFDSRRIGSKEVDHVSQEHRALQQSGIISTFEPPH